MIKLIINKTGPIKVKLSGRIVGEIRTVDDAYQYFPKGQKIGGQKFKTVQEVQNSLETE